MAFRVGLRNPHAFAGVLFRGDSFSTRTIGTHQSRQRVRRLPLFIAQGRDAEKYSVDRVL